MAAGSTYTPIATITVGSAVASYTFSSIPSTYTDLVLIGSINTSSEGGSVVMRFNSDSATNYSHTFLYNNSAGNAASGRGTSITGLYVQGVAYGSPSATNTFAPFITQIQNYSNTTTYKTALTRAAGMQNWPSGDVESLVGMWRSTSAITSIYLYNNNSSNFSVGTTLTLYGITAA